MPKSSAERAAPRRTGAASAADFRICRETLRAGSKSFFGASLLLPERLAGPASAVYAFCRIADDAVDLDADPRGALAGLRVRLDAVYAGRPMARPVDRALASVVNDFGLPRELPEALFEGFEWDLDGRRYATTDALLDYCVRVAGTVGLMMAVLMGVRDRERLTAACDLGVAMQLTNIARDVGEDARNGRIYLPLDALAAEGIDADAFVADPRPSAPLQKVVGRILDLADRFYLQAEPGIAGLPLGCRPGIYAARFVYAGIGDELRRKGLDSVTRRVHPSAARKALLTGRALAASVTGMPHRTVSVTVDARALLDASAAAPVHAWLRPKAEAQLEKVIDMFERLEARDRARREGRRRSAGAA